MSEGRAQDLPLVDPWGPEALHLNPQNCHLPNFKSAFHGQLGLVVVEIEVPGHNDLEYPRFCRSIAPCVSCQSTCTDWPAQNEERPINGGSEKLSPSSVPNRTRSPIYDFSHKITLQSFQGSTALADRWFLCIDQGSFLEAGNFYIGRCCHLFTQTE